jgi:hypothetical protein
MNEETECEWITLAQGISPDSCFLLGRWRRCFDVALFPEKRSYRWRRSLWNEPEHPSCRHVGFGHSRRLWLFVHRFDLLSLQSLGIFQTQLVDSQMGLGPLEIAMLEISGKLGISALSDQTYLYSERMNFIFGTVQCFLLIFTLFISVFKPWKKKKVPADSR